MAMSRSIGIRALLVMVVLCCAPFASACEKCSQYFDWQSESDCFYCEYSYCGYFGCAVYQSSYFDYCDSIWPDSGDDGESCATQEGIATGRCGHGDQYGELVTPVSAAGREWKLVRLRTLKTGSTSAKRPKRG
jgi:hypothetical protein